MQQLEIVFVMLNDAFIHVAQYILLAASCLIQFLLLQSLEVSSLKSLP